VSDSSKPHNIADSLASVLDSVARAADASNRDARSVQLLAVSKKKPLESIELAWQAGQRAFGENYADEALKKIQSWQERHPDSDIEWHFIGAIQSRKAASIAAHFDWVHSVDRLKVAKKLAENRADTDGPLSICLQVNLDGEASKSGIPADEVELLADQIAELPKLRLRGLMCIPAPRSDLEEQRAVFRQLATLQESLKSKHPALDTLSMGMSGDLDAAIAEGATIVRIGTAIFGARDAVS